MKSLMLWKDDFKNGRDWIALCKALDIPKNTVEIEMNCNVCVHKSHYTSKKRDRDYETLGERILEIEHNKEE